MSYQPQYQISNQILNAVASAEASKQIIENALLVPHWERSFQNQALIRSVHHSTAIEGNKLNIEEAQKVIEGEEINTYRLRDVKEIVNYRDAIGLVSANDEKQLTIRYLLKIQETLGKGLLPSKDLGALRHNDAVVVNSRTGEVVFDAPSKVEIQSELEDLMQWENDSADTYHPLIKAGILHYEIVRIHPFVDLNGRTARLIATWSLYRDGYDINRFFSLEEYYDQDLKKYYEAIDTAHDGDLTLWLAYFTKGVAQELERVKGKVLEINRDRRLKLKLGQVALSDRQMKIVSYLEDKDELKNPEFATIFPDVSDDTILRDLKDLMDKGIIVKKGRTKASKYILKV